MPETLLDYFALYGPFAVLFVVLFYWTLNTYKQREELYRKDIAEIRAEMTEQSKQHYEVLSKFADKYDLVITEIRELKSKVERS
ncbi:BhlA/UviB family holin-like peptide [Paenibacillus naphthalenovorans]|uniref:BhlA/UviB family holin-like peptide n=1 Tax=Paenibacillus naphthalenovorans TaxID=162209 RepID=UPI003D2C9604